MKKLLLIVLVVLVAGCVQQGEGRDASDIVPSIVGPKDCGENIGCFETALEECSPAKVSVIAPMLKRDYEIIERDGDLCIIKYTLTGQFASTKICHVARSSKFGSFEMYANHLDLIDCDGAE